MDDLDLDRLARLAGLNLSRDEAAALARDLVPIVRFLNTLPVLNDEPVRPLPAGREAGFRQDRPNPSRRINGADLAPEQRDGEIRVPPVMGEDT